MTTEDAIIALIDLDKSCELSIRKSDGCLGFNLGKSEFEPSLNNWNFSMLDAIWFKEIGGSCFKYHLDEIYYGVSVFHDDIFRVK